MQLEYICVLTIKKCNLLLNLISKLNYKLEIEMIKDNLVMFSFLLQKPHKSLEPPFISQISNIMFSLTSCELYF